MTMHLFFHRILSVRPNKPRNPLMKAVLSVFGLFFLFGVCMFAIVAGVFMLIASFLFKRFGKKSLRRAYEPDILEGEYSVVRPVRIDLPR
jgi:hypothetical protein